MSNSIYWIKYYAVTAIFQSYNGESNQSHVDNPRYRNNSRRGSLWIGSMTAPKQTPQQGNTKMKYLPFSLYIYVYVW